MHKTSPMVGTILMVFTIILRSYLKQRIITQSERSITRICNYQNLQTITLMRDVRGTKGHQMDLDGLTEA
jgi:hypothetical protein